MSFRFSFLSPLKALLVPVELFVTTILAINFYASSSIKQSEIIYSVQFFESQWKKHPTTPIWLKYSQMNLRLTAPFIMSFILKLHNHLLSPLLLSPHVWYWAASPRCHLTILQKSVNSLLIYSVNYQTDNSNNKSILHYLQKGLKMICFQLSK